MVVIRTTKNHFLVVNSPFLVFEDIFCFPVKKKFPFIQCDVRGMGGGGGCTIPPGSVSEYISSRMVLRKSDISVAVLYR